MDFDIVALLPNINSFEVDLISFHNIQPNRHHTTTKLDHLKSKNIHHEKLGTFYSNNKKNDNENINSISMPPIVNYKILYF